MTPEIGSLAFSDLEGLVLAMDGRRHLIYVEDVRDLLVYGKVVPVVKDSPSLADVQGIDPETCNLIFSYANLRTTISIRPDNNIYQVQGLYVEKRM